MACNDLCTINAIDPYQNGKKTVQWVFTSIEKATVEVQGATTEGPTSADMLPYYVAFETATVSLGTFRVLAFDILST